VRQMVLLSLELTRGICESRARLSTEWEDVPCVLAHPERLVQVFTQLLTNAAEAIAAGAPRDNAIAVSVRRGGPSTVEVEFRDTGSGIPNENAGFVFEPFFTTKENSTGLGLAICQSIVRSFNGEIRFEQEQPRGSVFRVSLPAAG
jgi:two-component system NtrC family sensor kinase